MNLEFAYIRETVEDCEARIAASKAWLAMMDNALGHLPTAEQLQPAIKAVVQGVELIALPVYEMRPEAIGLTKTALDGERNGRLAWMPGA
jgi:hypothetical protein